MSRPLIISAPQLEDIARVIAHAERERFTLAEMKARHDIKLVKAGQDIHEQLRETDPDRPTVGDDPGHRCVLPIGFQCCFSFEEQLPPLGWCRHLSVSIVGPGSASRSPNEFAMGMIMEAFGFRHKLCLGAEGERHNIVYLERQRVVNVIEPETDVPGGLK